MLLSLEKPKKCRNCGRTLRSLESIQRGFGPHCAIAFADKWIHEHPKYLSPAARKLWTPEEVRTLVKTTMRR